MTNVLERNDADDAAEIIKAHRASRAPRPNTRGPAHDPAGLLPGHGGRGRGGAKVWASVAQRRHSR